MCTPAKASRISPATRRNIDSAVFSAKITTTSAAAAISAVVISWVVKCTPLPPASPVNGPNP